MNHLIESIKRDDPEHFRIYWDLTFFNDETSKFTTMKRCQYLRGMFYDASQDK